MHVAAEPGTSPQRLLKGALSDTHLEGEPPKPAVSWVSFEAGRGRRKEEPCQLRCTKTQPVKIFDAIKIVASRDFPGGPVAKDPHSQSRGSRFYPSTGIPIDRSLY